MSVKLKRIKTRDDLKDVLCMIEEDVSTFKPVNCGAEVRQWLRKAIECVEQDHVVWTKED